MMQSIHCFVTQSMECSCDPREKKYTHTHAQTHTFYVLMTLKQCVLEGVVQNVGQKPNVHVCQSAIQ